MRKTRTARLSHILHSRTSTVSQRDRDFEQSAREDEDNSRRRDEGRYESGYRVYRDGSYREDFGSDR